jgi:phospholipid N-methyltransferase
VTNDVTSPVAATRLGIAAREAARVWRNLPPAQIWSYSLPAESPP